MQECVGSLAKHFRLGERMIWYISLRTHVEVVCALTQGMLDIYQNQQLSSETIYANTPLSIYHNHNKSAINNCSQEGKQVSFEPNTHLSIYHVLWY